MTTLRRLAALLLCTVLTATVGGACADAGSGDGNHAGPVRLLVFGAPEELAAYRTLADAYRKAHPDRTIQLVEASDREPEDGERPRDEPPKE